MTETPASAGDATETVADFLRRWTAAELTGDGTTLAQLLAEGFIGVGPLGFTLSKADWLERHVDRALTYRRYELDEITVHGYPGAIVVVARQDAEGDWRGHPVPGTLRISLVLVPAQGRWQLALVQTGFIAGTPGAPPIPGVPPSSPR